MENEVDNLQELKIKLGKNMIVNEQFLDNYMQGTPWANFYLEKIDGRKNYGGLHRHNFFQLILLEKGTINQTIDFEHHTMEPQSASLIFPFQLHDFSLSPDAEAYMVMFDETVFCSEILHNDLKDYNIDLQKRVNYVAFHNEKDTFQDITPYHVSHQPRGQGSLYHRTRRAHDKEAGRNIPRKIKSCPPQTWTLAAVDPSSEMGTCHFGSGVGKILKS